MQKLCCVCTRQHPLPVWSYNLSLTNLLISQPILNHFRWELYHPEASTPHARPPDTIPTFITPSAPPSIPPVWEHVIAVLMKLPPTTAEGHESLGDLPLPYLSRRLLDVGIAYSPI